MFCAVYIIIIGGFGGGGGGGVGVRIGVGVVVLTLSHRYNIVRGYKAGFNFSGKTKGNQKAINSL